MAAGATGRAFQVKIVGDVNDAKRSLQSLDKRAGAFTKAMKIAGGAMVAAFAVKKVFDFGASAVKRAEEMASAYAITETIIQQTEGAANITAGSLKDLNRELSIRTGIDKALITSGSNVLLTFKGIRNEVGEGNAIFDRANSVMLDMATVFGGDAKQAATQLGKALDNPIAGVGALARVGVTFTDQQKEMIRTLQESGNTLDAQKIILEALEGQVGGTAEASADSTAKIKNGWLEVQEWIGTMLLPMLDKLAAWFVDVAIPAIETLVKWVEKNWPPIWEDYIQPIMEAIREGIEFVWDWISGFWAESGDGIMATVKEWGGLIWDYYSALFGLIQEIVEKVMAAVAWVWEKYGDKITAVVSAWYDTISSIVGFIMDVLKGLIQFMTAVFQGDWSAAWDAITGIGQTVLDFFAEFPGKLLGYLRSAVNLVGSAAADLGRAIINGIIGFWNRLDPRITVGPMPSWIPLIGGKAWTSPDLFPDIPRLAAGGITTGPTIAMIGEGRYDEAVIPLKPGQGLGGNTYQIQVDVAPGADLADAGRQLVDAITAYERSAGEGWRTSTAAGY